MAHDKHKKVKEVPSRGAPLFISLGVLFMAIFSLHLLFVSSFFQVKTIRWKGVHRLDPRTLNQQFQSVLGQSLIYLNVSELHAEMLGHPWVKTVVVRKVLPSQIEVMITERVPVAVEINPKNNKRILRDSDGVVLEEGETAGLPQMIHYNPQAYQKAKILISLLSGHSDALLDLSNAEDVRVSFPRQGGMIRFGDRDYRKRWERFKAVEADLHRRHIVPWEADLRFPSKVVVRPGKQTIKEVRWDPSASS